MLWLLDFAVAVLALELRATLALAGIPFPACRELGSSAVLPMSTRY